MKRNIPNDPLGKCIYFAKQNKLNIVLITIIIILLLASLSKKITGNGTETVDLIVANTDIPVGKTIAPEDIREMKFIKGYHPKNGIRSDDVDLVLGKSVNVSLKEGDLVRNDEVIDKNSKLNSLKKYLQNDESLFYLKIDAVHTFPIGLTEGDLITIYSYNRSNQETEALAIRTRVIDILAADTTQTGNSLYAVGLALDQEQIMQLMQAVGENWLIQIVVVK